MTEPSPDHATHDRSREIATIPAASPLEDLRGLVLAAAEELAGRPVGAGDGRDGAGARGGRAAVTLERPPRAQMGDYSTNAALLLAPGLGEQPRALAERLGRVLERELGSDLRRFEVAGPGFLNLFVA